MNAHQPIEQTRADELVIDNLETLKVIADQRRKLILEHFDNPSTVKEVAQKLGTSPSKLYYHVNLLEEHGLLVVTDTRIVSGIIEKQYQTAAKRFRVKAGLLSPSSEDGDASMEAMLVQFFDEPRDEARNSLRNGIIQIGEDAEPHLKIHLLMSTISVDRERALAFYEKIRDLADEIQQLESNENGEQAYLIQFSMFPIANTDFGDNDA